MLKKIVKKIINLAGFDLHRLSPASNPAFQLLKVFNRFEVDLVLDVGANIGQFASGLRSVGYKGNIVSFEPLSAAHMSLSEAARCDPKWHVHSRGAVGDYNGEILINIAGNSVSSSILPMLKYHSDVVERSSYIGREVVPIVTLDSVSSKYLSKKDRIFIKIDTQGFEWQVLDGASATLNNVQGLMLELSLVPLYAGQRLWIDIIDRLTSNGFMIWAILPGFTDPRDGRTLQIDAIFVREESV